jgi:hypothetical protein
MLKPLAIAAALACVSGSALAQSVEFRVVERRAQKQVTPPFTDNVLDFAVQARVVGAPDTGLGQFQFNIHLVGEPEASGTLTRVLISNTDGTYATNGFSNNGTVGRGGIAAPYSYLAGISAFFNGLINTSGGSFTNGPDQEILAITGSPTGNAMLLVTDLNGDGNPDTWPGTGTAAPLDVALANTYFAANGNFIDLYHFKYTLSDTTTQRSITVTLEALSAQTFTSWVFTNGVWGPVQSNAPFSVTTATFSVGGFGACCELSNVCSLASAQTCSGVAFLVDGVCSPNPCPIAGFCCDAAGACTVAAPSTCPGVWQQGASCSPNPCQQPVRCCASTGVCTLVLPSACTGTLSTGTSCTPNPCPQPAACCAPAGTCTLVLQSACAGTWLSGSVCIPSLCQPGACCTSAGACSITLASVCTSTWTLGGACTPNLCPVLGACCAPLGACTFILSSACTGVFRGGVCLPNPCPQNGSCCKHASCTVTTEGNCSFNLGGQFLGVGIACAPLGTFGSCCYANFNGDGVLSVQDIFDFLSAWFAGDPRADFNQDTHLNVYDIFSFIAGWRNGCP